MLNKKCRPDLLRLNPRKTRRWGHSSIHPSISARGTRPSSLSFLPSHFKSLKIVVRRIKQQTLLFREKRWARGGERENFDCVVRIIGSVCALLNLGFCFRPLRPFPIVTRGSTMPFCVAECWERRRSPPIGLDVIGHRSMTRPRPNWFSNFPVQPVNWKVIITSRYLHSAPTLFWLSWLVDHAMRSDVRSRTLRYPLHVASSFPSVRIIDIGGGGERKDLQYSYTNWREKEECWEFQFKRGRVFGVSPRFKYLAPLWLISPLSHVQLHTLFYQHIQCT